MGTSVRNETIDDLIRSKRVLILCGSGGVGKTTSSGALALRAAELGRRTVVVTIDPAKRLATSLGISSLSSTPSNLTHLIKGKTPSAGELWAVMPDTNEVFESFIKSMAKTQAKAAERVLRTSIYKIFVQDFSGANE
ncbi:MAG TPA: ArsA-related P-loop ATPase, partial [Oligoflexia bacterium]|nr:ArsA-related P-loop ATPase [Oligoflexia bacterium]